MSAVSATGSRAPAAVGRDPRRQERARDLRMAALVFVVALGLSLIYFHQAWGSPTDTWRGNPGDPEQTMWFLGWQPFALLHGHNPLVTNFQLYPGGANLMWNTSVVLPGLLTAPLTLLTNATVSYNLLLLLAPAAGAATGYWAFRRWSGRAGAALGGLLFAFSPFPMIHSAGHLHLLLTALMPVTLLLLDELLVRQRWPFWATGLALGVVTAAQLMTSEEILAIEAVVGATGVVVLAATHPRRVAAKVPYLVTAGVVAGVTFLLLATYPLYTQYRGPAVVHSAVHDNRVYVTDLLNLVLPVNQWLGGHAAGTVTGHFTGNPSEWTGYVGIPLLVVVGVLVALRWRRPLVRVVFLTAALAYLYSLGPTLHVDGRVSTLRLPWDVLDRLPTLSNVLPGRLTVAVDLLVALLVAVAVDEILRAVRPLRWAGVAALVLVALSWVPGGLATTTIPTPAFFTGAGVSRVPAGSVAVVLPLAVDPYTEGPLLWQMRARMHYRMPEGWAIIPGNHYGPQTATYLAFAHLPANATQIDPDQLSAVQAEWRRWHVRTVIDVPHPGTPDGVASVVQQIVGAPPQHVGGVEVWYDVRA